MSDWLDDDVLTERLRLRQFTDADVEAQVALLMDQDVREYVGGAKSSDEARRLVRGTSPWGHFAVADRNSDLLLGTLSFDQKRGPWEASFQLRRDKWGHGLMREALVAARDWFFDNNGAEAFIAVTQEGNERTRRMLLRLGAIEGSTFTQYGLPQVEYTLSRVVDSGAV